MWVYAGILFFLVAGELPVRAENESDTGPEIHDSVPERLSLPRSYFSNGRIPNPFGVPYVSTREADEYSAETKWGEEIISARDIAGKPGHAGAWVVWAGYQKQKRQSTILLQAVNEYGVAVGPTKTLYTLRGLVDHARLQMLPTMSWLLLQVRTNGVSPNLVSPHGKSTLLTLWAIPFTAQGDLLGNPLQLQTSPTRRDQLSRLEAMVISGEQVLVSGTVGSSYEVFLLKSPSDKKSLLHPRFHSLGQRLLPGNVEELDTLLEMNGMAVAEGTYTKKRDPTNQMFSQTILAPLRQDAKPFPYHFPTCAGAINRFWTGKAWVSLCQENAELPPQELEKACPVHTKEGENTYCWFVDVQSEDETLVSAKPETAAAHIRTPLLAYEEHCDQDHPVLDIRYLNTNQEKVSLRMSSVEQVGTKTRMSLGVPHVWTGKALLGFGNGEDHAQVIRRTCLANGTLHTFTKEQPLVFSQHETIK